MQREKRKSSPPEAGRRNPLDGDHILVEVILRLAKAYRPERIYLFGSKARGESGPDSDYDIMIVVPDDVPPERLRSRLAYQVLRGTGAAADVVVWPKTRFDNRIRVLSSLPATVIREGRLLYAS